MSRRLIAALMLVALAGGCDKTPPSTPNLPPKGTPPAPKAMLPNYDAKIAKQAAPPGKKS